MDRGTSDIAARYERDGYVIADARLPAEQLAELQWALDDIIKENPGRRPEHLGGALAGCHRPLGGRRERVHSGRG